MCSWQLRPPSFATLVLCPLGMNDLAEYEIPEYASIQIKENPENIDGE